MIVYSFTATLCLRRFTATLYLRRFTAILCHKDSAQPLYLRRFTATLCLQRFTATLCLSRFTVTLCLPEIHCDHVPAEIHREPFGYGDSQRLCTYGDSPRSCVYGDSPRPCAYRRCQGRDLCPHFKMIRPSFEAIYKKWDSKRLLNRQVHLAPYNVPDFTQSNLLLPFLSDWPTRLQAEGTYIYLQVSGGLPWSAPALSQ